MATELSLIDIPNTDNRPPVQSVGFIRALRYFVYGERVIDGRTVTGDPCWERDDASRRARDWWRYVFDTDRVTPTDPYLRDLALADIWWNRLYLIDTGYHLDNLQAWNEPIFQEFMAGYWHPGVPLPWFAPPSAQDSRANRPDWTTAAAEAAVAARADEATRAARRAGTTGATGATGAAGAAEGTVPEVTIHPQTGGNAGSGNDAAGNAATGDVAGSDAAGESSTINSPDRPRHRATTRSTPERDDRGTLGTAVTPGQLPSTPASGPPGQLPTPFTGPGQTGDPTANAGTPSRAPTTAPPTTPPTAPPTAPPPNTAPPPRRPQQPAGNVAQPLQPSLSDMQEPHTWRDQRQPPVGARLLQILNWVNDEDIDRRRDWARELDEAEAWVLEQLDKRDENCLGDDTITLLRQAEAAMQTHRRNERYHYRTFMDLTIPKPDELPKYAPRLPYNSDDPIRLGVAGPKSKTTKIQPQLPDTPRPWRAVNNMWLTERERVLSLTPTLPDAREDGLLTLAASEDRLWAPQDGQDLQTINNNTVLAENGSYSTAIANDATSFSRGWVHWTQDPDAQEATRTIAGSNAPLLNTDNDFAVERGARRAGLQTALRQFHSAENHMIADNGRMLVLPGGTKAEAVPDLEEVKRKAGIGNSRPIPLTELPANQMQRIDGKTDPQGFIANMAQWWREARAARPDTHRYAMEGTFQRIYDVMHADRRDGRHALPPLSSFGPFVWRGVTAKVQLRQDCLRQMRGLKKLFEREKSIAMRQLLFDMDRAYQRGFDLDDDPEDLLMMDYFRDAVVSQSDSVDSDNPRYLDQMELDWIRFLLNHSMTEGMASEVLPRTAIFLAFAQRLERIFSDPGDSLFPDTETSVTIEDLIAHMAKMKGPVEKTTFYVYDVKMFLERLAFQGRCRYTEDWRSYGRVQRPVLKYYPENLIIWRPRNGIDTNELDYPEDRRTLTPRFEDVRTWHAIVHQEPQALDEDVRNYFLCLAYRWGWGTRYLETQEHEWKTTQPLPLHKSSDIVRRLVQGHEYCMGDGQNGGAARRVAADMETLWRHTLSKPDTAELPHDTTAIELIRKGVLHEVVRADNMLYPGRSTDYKDLLAPKTRESIWDWAKPQVRGKSKKFFSLNRWPLQLQSAKTQQRIKDDVDVDTSMLWNPIVEDPTPWTYYRPKAKPYGDDRIQFKSDQRLFPIGDTGRQKEVVKNQVMAMVGTAMGIMPDDSTANDGVFSKLKGMLGFSRKRPRALLDNPDDDDDDDHVAHRHKLPRVDPSSVPPTGDVIAEAEAAMRAYEDATRLDVIPADQVPAGAQDVRFINRAVPNRDNALVVEQNMPL